MTQATREQVLAAARRWWFWCANWGLECSDGRYEILVDDYERVEQLGFVGTQVRFKRTGVFAPTLDALLAEIEKR